MIEETPVYLLLGARGSLRRALLADMIVGYFEPNESVRVYLPAGESRETEGALALAHCAECCLYDALSDLPPPVIGHPTFVLPPGDCHPADAIEGFDAWLRRYRLTLTRIITVVHGRLQVENPERMTPWHRACVHFSDAVLLSRREGLAPTALKEFLTYFEKERYPCPFELVKKGRVPNPALVLAPESRRMSLMFERDLEAVDFLEIDEDNLPEETIDLKRPVDPYLESDASGQRTRVIPDIGPALDPSEED